MNKNTIIDGIAASEHLDSSGESLDINGMDISSLGGADSILNWEHGSKDRPSQVVGKVTFAKKILKKDQAKTKREKYFWNKVKKPFVYIKAELFDGIGHSGAQDVAAMLRYKNRDKGEESRLIVGFSIEGGKMDKKGMVVTKSIARDVAITVKPCNKVCDAEIIQNDSDDDDFLYKNQDFDCEILEKGSVNINTSTYRDLIISDIKKSTVGNASMGNFDTKRIFDSGQEPDALKTGDKILHNKNASKPKTGKDIYNDPKTWDTDNNMRKALIAGMMGGTPSAKTGMAALAPEDLDKEIKHVSKKKTKKLNKNENEIDDHTYLEHYSPHQGLKSISPENMGSGVDRRTRGRSMDNKISFYYPHNYEKPEHRVKSTSKSKYKVRVPKDFKIWDGKLHGQDMVQKAKERNNGIFTTDHFVDTLRENGYHGFKSTPSGIDMVAMFHDLPVHSEEEVDHRIQKAQPSMSFGKLGVENKPDMQVKTIDPNKTYTTREGNQYSQAEVEGKKIANKYRQGQKDLAGAKSMDEFDPDSQKYVQDVASSYSKDINPEEHKGVNIADSNVKLNEAYEYKQEGDENKYPSTKHHEGLHRTFSSIAEKHSPSHSKNLTRHILENFFNKDNIKGVSDFVSTRYEKDDPHLKEEHLTHILDLLTNKEKRNDHNELYVGGKVGDIDYKDLKSGWKKAVQFTKQLTPEKLEEINSKYSQKKPKQVEIQKIPPGGRN